MYNPKAGSEKRKKMVEVGRTAKEMSSKTWIRENGGNMSGLTNHAMNFARGFKRQ